MTFLADRVKWVCICIMGLKVWSYIYGFGYENQIITIWNEKCWSNYLWHFHINRNETRFPPRTVFHVEIPTHCSWFFQLIAAQIHIFSSFIPQKLLKITNIFNYSLFFKSIILVSMSGMISYVPYCLCWTHSRLDYRQDVSLNWPDWSVTPHPDHQFQVSDLIIGGKKWAVHLQSHALFFLTKATSPVIDSHPL